MNQIDLDRFGAWLAAHCCCCGAERPVGKWEAAEWMELILILPGRANNPAWQCPACWRRVARLVAGLEEEQSDDIRTIGR